MTTTDCPEPGVYHGVPFTEYAAWEAVNQSRLKLLAKSPRHYRDYCAAETSDALTFGSLAHAAFLEPLEVASQFAVEPPWHLDAENVTAKGDRTDSKLTGYVREKRKQFAEACRGKQIVDADTFSRAVAVCESLNSDGPTARIVNTPGRTEVSIVWDDPATGVRCKARIDKACDDGRLVDLKTTSDLLRFHDAVGRYGYHNQAAFYCRGWATLHRSEMPEFWIVAVESSPPHCVAAAALCDEAIDQGQREIDGWLALLVECHESGAWPGPEPPSKWRLPAWAVKDEPLELTIGGATVSV